jgi:hypothetical protein
MLRDLEPHDLTAAMSQDEHDKEQPECRGRHGEHVDRSDAVGLIAQEGAPGRRRQARLTHHVLGNGRLADLETELEQLTVDARRTPERVGSAHLPGQVTDFALCSPPSRP